jgi:transcriptional regulator with XRE-family HTH domain
MAKRGRIDQTSGPVTDVTPDERAEFKRLRKSKKLRQDQLAAKIHVSPATISNIETGRSGQVRREPYLEALRYLRGSESEPASGERFKRVMEKFLKLDDANQIAVEAMINALLPSPRDSR